jgi:hypothetical protein
VVGFLFAHITPVRCPSTKGNLRLYIFPFQSPDGMERRLMGAPGAMDWFDAVVNGLFGFTALTFILRDRKTA